MTRNTKSLEKMIEEKSSHVEVHTHTSSKKEKKKKHSSSSSSSSSKSKDKNKKGDLKVLRDEWKKDM